MPRPADAPPRSAPLRPAPLTPCRRPPSAHASSVSATPAPCLRHPDSTRSAHHPAGVVDARERATRRSGPHPHRAARRAPRPLIPVGNSCSLPPARRLHPRRAPPAGVVDASPSADPHDAPSRPTGSHPWPPSLSGCRRLLLPASPASAAPAVGAPTRVSATPAPCLRHRDSPRSAHRPAGVADRGATPTTCRSCRAGGDAQGLQELPTGCRRAGAREESWVASAARRGRLQSGPGQGVGNSCSVVEDGVNRGRAGLHAGAADGVPPPRGSEESRRRTACTVTDVRHQRGHTRLACRQLLPRGVQVRQRGRSAARSRSCRPAGERTRGRHASSKRS
ncbi:hypothetical protein ABID92_000495 [Frigoribacterium sp. PvP120]|nr:hypothetical protein [Frigoribacterium sp. PvP121]